MRKADTLDAHFRVDPKTLQAIEQAAAQDDRNRSDWIRAVIKRELRNRGLLEERNGRPKRQRSRVE